MSDEWMTTQEAAHFAGYHVDHIRRLIRAGKLDARKFGPVWAISKEAIEQYLREVEATGEKRGPKPEN